MVRRNEIGTIYHLAALLSAVAESKPQVAWEVNMGSLYHVLEVARENRCAVFHPSSIGAFGPDTPPDQTPQDTVQRPTTMYGVTKVAGELLCDYYHHRFGVDARGVRFPGLISYVAPPGGGTTDYAVEIFYEAIRHRHYTCFLGPDTRLDMMYMPDAIKAAIDVMEADPARLVHRNAFNVTAMNFTPEELAAEIRKHIPEFTLDYHVDPVRQAIADSWPELARRQRRPRGVGLDARTTTCRDGAATCSRTWERRSGRPSDARRQGRRSAMPHDRFQQALTHRAGRPARARAPSRGTRR